MTRILAVSGSLRAGSYNTRLLRAAAALAPDGVEVELYDGLASLPPFDADREHDPPPAVADWRRRVAAADALLIATPEYNGSVPGQLKNAIDWASRPREDAVLRGKTAAVIGASTADHGGVTAQADLRRILGRAGARVVEGQAPVARAHDQLEGDGALPASTRRQLEGVLESLLAEVSAGTLAA